MLCSQAMNLENQPNGHEVLDRHRERGNEVAELVVKLLESNGEAAGKLIEDQGGVNIRGEIVPIQENSGAGDQLHTEGVILTEALEQCIHAAEEAGRRFEAAELALALSHFKATHEIHATYLDARARYPDLAAVMERVNPQLLKDLEQADKNYREYGARQIEQAA